MCIRDRSKTSELLRKAARDSYRLDKCMYEPLNISLASSFNCIQAYQKESRLIEQAIEKCIKDVYKRQMVTVPTIVSFVFRVMARFCTKLSRCFL